MIYNKEFFSISNLEASENIKEITNIFVEKLEPIKIFLFGSYALGTDTEDSDYDFYIVVDDGCNVSDTTSLAYKVIRNMRKRPVDIIVGTKTRFDAYSSSNDSLFVEGEVGRKGKLLYEMDRG